MTWRRLRVLIDALAATPGTLLHRRLSGDDWSRTEHLLALTVDALRVSNWQRSKDGTKASKRPKPISPLSQEHRGETVGDAGGRTPDEVKALLEQYHTGVFDHGG